MAIPYDAEGFLQFVNVVFPEHTYLLFLTFGSKPRVYIHYEILVVIYTT